MSAYLSITIFYICFFPSYPCMRFMFIFFILFKLLNVIWPILVSPFSISFIESHKILILVFFNCRCTLKGCLRIKWCIITVAPVRNNSTNCIVLEQGGEYPEFWCCSSSFPRCLRQVKSQPSAFYQYNLHPIYFPKDTGFLFVSKPYHSSLLWLDSGCYE